MTPDEQCISRLLQAIGKASCALEQLGRGVEAVNAGRPVFTLRELSDYAGRSQRDLDEAWAAALARRAEVRNAG